MDQMKLQHEFLKLDEMEYMLTQSQKKADDELSLIRRFFFFLSSKELYTTSDFNFI